MTHPYKKLQLPLSEETTRSLHVGDRVLLSGRLLTGRDQAHVWLLEDQQQDVAPYLKEGAVYHCGPIMIQRSGKWTCRAAGPTTSIREEPVEADVIRNYGLRCIIGKGGMGEKTLAALKEYGAVYCHATGGAAVAIADCITAVENVFCLDEFGVPEAMWLLQVRDLPLIVSMDSHGRSLHKLILDISSQKLEKLLS